jgi:hypothetical protein
MKNSILITLIVFTLLGCKPSSYKQSEMESALKIAYFRGAREMSIEVAALKDGKITVKEFMDNTDRLVEEFKQDIKTNSLYAPPR